jgi:hypothetical protein
MQCGQCVYKHTLIHSVSRLTKTHPPTHTRSVRLRLYSILMDVLLRSNIRELEIGVVRACTPRPAGACCASNLPQRHLNQAGPRLAPTVPTDQWRPCTGGTMQAARRIST